MLMQSARPLGELENTDEFIPRHIGIDDDGERHMLSVIGEASRRALIDSIVPRSIARASAMQLPPPVTRAENAGTFLPTATLPTLRVVGAAAVLAGAFFFAGAAFFFTAIRL